MNNMLQHYRIEEGLLRNQLDYSDTISNINPYETNRHSVEIFPSIHDHPSRQRILNGLKELQSNRIPFLYDYQIETICNNVFRPARMHIHTEQLNETQDCLLASDADYDYSNSACDIGRTCIVDLPTGSGKTIITLLSCILFAMERQQDTRESIKLLIREQFNDVVWYGGPLGNQKIPEYTNAIVIMVPKHLISQWEQSVLIVNQLLKSSISVFVNPLKTTIESLRHLTSNKPFICLYDNVSKLQAGGLLFVPIIAVDEFHLKNDHNISIKALSHRIPVFGRLLLVSATASSIAKTINRLRDNCLIKKWVRSNDNMNKAVHSLTSASVLSTSHREDMIDSLGLNVPIEIHNILYVPTLTGSMFGENMEVSRQCGTSVFKALGVDVSRCTTTAHIKTAVMNRLALPPPEHTWSAAMATNRATIATRNLQIMRDRETRTKLFKCIDALVRLSVTEDDCPICYDRMEEQCLIHPCFHYVCKTCMNALLERTNNSCPLCRANVCGVTTTVDEVENTDSEYTVNESSEFNVRSDLTMTESLQCAFTIPQSLLQSLTIILQHLEAFANAEDSDEPFRVLVAVPENIDFEELKEKVPVIKRFIIHGNPSNPISVKRVAAQLNDFKQQHGTKIRILFTSEGRKDHLSGLDFDNTDCLISVGRGNTIQRVGRLARLGRKYSRNKVLYFKLNQR